MPDQVSHPESRTGRSLRRALARVRATAKRWLIARAASLLAAAVVLAVGLAAALDFLLRTPAWLRGALWIAGVIALVVAIRRLVLPALRFAPSLTETALRVERSPAGERAGLRDRLASALELADDRSPLAHQLVSGVVEGVRKISPASVLAPTEPRRVLGACAAVLVVAGGFAILQPTLATIGVARIATPWTGASWPKRTQIADATSATVHPTDEALALRASLARTPWGEGRTEVVAHYRIRSPSGDEGPVRRVVLTSQGREQGAELFERLIELPGNTRDGASVDYWFETVDDRTESATVRLATRPALARVRASIVPPAYANNAEGLAAFTSTADARPDNEAAVIVGPVLAGSHVDLALEFNKPVAHDPASPAIPGADGAGLFLSEGDGKTWRLDADRTDGLALSVLPTDSSGLAARAPASVVLDVVEDAPPSVVVLDPARDEAMLASARIALQGEGHDDVGLAHVRLEAQRLAAPASAPSASPEPVGDAAIIASWSRTGAAPVESRVAGEIDLESLGAQPGDEVVLAALASDVHNPDAFVRSAPRRIRVIEPAELIDQLRGQLSAVRRTAMDLDRAQAQAQRRTELTGATAETAAQQAAIAERLTSPLETVRSLADRATRNGLQDAGLDDLLHASAELLDLARTSAAEAADQLGAGESGPAGNDDPNAPDAEQATPAGEQADIEAAEEAQARVRDNLGELINALDRGEDGWAARRDVERLLAEQRDLAERTQALADQLAGISPDEMTPAQRSAIERIAERQLEAARRADNAMNALNERAEQLDNRDPAMAQAMREAAARARQERLGDTLEQASEQIAQNQTQNAQQLQQDAIEAMEQMLGDLDGAERNRDQALRRVLASLIDSIEALINQQRAELASLAQAGGDPALLAPLDEGMIRVNRNTLGVLDELARQEGVAPQIGDQLETASEQQGAAITALRATDAGVAEAGELASLEALIAARDAASEQDEQAAAREADRARRELRAAYRELLERQVLLRAEAEDFAGKTDLSRRDRAAVRAIGERQDSVRTSLAELRDQTNGMDDTVIFSLAHDRLNTVTERAADELGQGRASTIALRSQDSAVRMLQSLVEALKESTPPQQFDQGAGGGGGGGGGGQGGGEQGEPPLVPPLAELRLLRGMQSEVALWTRAIDEGPVRDVAEVRDLGELQRELSARGSTLIEQLTKDPSDTGGRP